MPTIATIAAATVAKASTTTALSIAHFQRSMYPPWQEGTQPTSRTMSIRRGLHVGGSPDTHRHDEMPEGDLSRSDRGPSGALQSPASRQVVPNEGRSAGVLLRRLQRLASDIEGAVARCLNV